MNTNHISKGILQALAVISGISLLLYFLFEIRSILVYLAISGVISLIGSPIITFLKAKLKFPNTVAVIFTMLIFIGFLSGLISMFIPLIIEQGENLSLLNIEQFQTTIQEIKSTF